MKKITFIQICIFILFINSCDSGSQTIIEVINNSSYNLHITINLKYAYSSNRDYYDIYVNKDESSILKLVYAGGIHNPNEQIGNIIFRNLHTEEIINEIILNGNNIFEYLRTENTGVANSHNISYFQLIINDNML
jgi:hypothetical protein